MIKQEMKKVVALCILLVYGLVSMAAGAMAEGEAQDPVAGTSETAVETVSQMTAEEYAQTFGSAPYETDAAGTEPYVEAPVSEDPATTPASTAPTAEVVWYTVAFYDLYGQFINDVTVEAGAGAQAPEQTPYVDGLLFQYWYDAAGMSDVPYVFGSAVTKNIDLVPYYIYATVQMENPTATMTEEDAGQLVQDILQGSPSTPVAESAPTNVEQPVLNNVSNDTELVNDILSGGSSQDNGGSDNAGTAPVSNNSVVQDNAANAFVEEVLTGSADNTASAPVEPTQSIMPNDVATQIVDEILQSNPVPDTTAPDMGVIPSVGSVEQDAEGQISSMLSPAQAQEMTGGRLRDWANESASGSNESQPENNNDPINYYNEETAVNSGADTLITDILSDNTTDAEPFEGETVVNSGDQVLQDILGGTQDSVTDGPPSVNDTADATVNDILQGSDANTENTPAQTDSNADALLNELVGDTQGEAENEQPSANDNAETIVNDILQGSDGETNTITDVPVQSDSNADALLNEIVGGSQEDAAGGQPSVNDSAETIVNDVLNNDAVNTPVETDDDEDTLDGADALIEDILGGTQDVTVDEQPSIDDEADDEQADDILSDIVDNVNEDTTQQDGEIVQQLPSHQGDSSNVMAGDAVDALINGILGSDTQNDTVELETEESTDATVITTEETAGQQHLSTHGGNDGSGQAMSDNAVNALLDEILSGEVAIGGSDPVEEEETESAEPIATFDEMQAAESEEEAESEDDLSDEDEASEEDEETVIIEESPAEAPTVKVSYSYDGELEVGTPITVRATVTGLPEGTVVQYQWLNNASGDYQPVPGATGPEHNFLADESNTDCQWRVSATIVG